MADLKINIVVDDNGAVRKLNEIEDAEKRVKAASDGSASSVASQARGIVLSFQNQERSAVNAATAAENLAVSTANVAASAKKAIPTFSEWAGANGNSAKAMADYIRFAGQASSATDVVAETAVSATSSVGGLTAATGTLGLSAGALGVAIVGVTTALGALFAVVVDSSKAYIEQADEMAGVRSELGNLGNAWNDLKLQIGEAVLGGTGGAALTWLQLLEIGIRAAGAAAAAEIAKIRALLGLIMPLGTFTRGAQAILGLPTPAEQDLGFPLPTPVGFTPLDQQLAVRNRAGVLQGGLSGSQAESLFNQDEAARKRREADAERIRQAEQRAIDELTGAATLKAFDDFTRRLSVAGGLTVQTTAITKKYADVVFDVIEKQALLGDGASKAWDAAKNAALKAIDQIEARAIPLSAGLSSLLGIGTPTDVLLNETAALHGVNMTPSRGVPIDPFTGLPYGAPLGNEARPGAFDAFGGFIPGTVLPNETRPGLNFGALGSSASVLAISGLLGGQFGNRSSERYLTMVEQLFGKSGVGLLSHTSGTAGVLGGSMASIGLGLMMSSQGKAANAASGALTGAGIGTMIMPGIGTAIGAGVGALGGYIKGLLSQAGRNLVKQYADSFGGFPELHKELNQLGDEGEQLWIKLTQGVGHANASQAKEVIGEIDAAFKALQERIEGVKKAVSDLSSPGTLASLDQLKTIANAGNTPEEQAALRQYYQTQTSNTVGGLTQFVDNTNFTSQASASGATSATLATFSLLQNQGLSMGEIMAQLGPVIDALKQKLIDAKLQGGDAFGTLIHYSDLFANKSVQQADAALKGLIVTETGLANVGGLTSETFAGLNHSIVDTAAALQKQGLSATDIQMILHPAIQRAWELEHDFGVEADDATQAMIDQAVQAGTVGEQFRDPTTQLTDAIKQMVTKLGEFVSMWETGLPNAVGTGVERANKRMGGLNYPAPPGGGGGGGGGTGSEEPEPGDPGYDPGLPKAHSGGLLWRRMHVGGLASGEIPIIGLEGEFMMSRRGVAANGRSVLERMNRGERLVGGGVSTTNVWLDGKLLASASAPHLPGAVKNLVPRYA